MSYDNDFNSAVSAVLNSNETYYKMIVEWHAIHDGLAVEPEIKSLIEGQCKPGFHILEAGSGPGCITNWFAARYPGVRFTGVDISHIGVQIARETAPCNAEYHVTDLKNLPFMDHSFDFIFSQSVLEHIVGWEEALAELHRVIVPGGGLLIRVGNGGVGHGSSRFQALLNYVLFRNRAVVQAPSFHLQPGEWSDHQTNFDVQEIPSDVLLRSLRRCGFSISHFTTGTQHWRHSENWKARCVSRLKFWPFIHLGDTTIVLAEKRSL
jgi:SAM-dependent methyltransferase